MKKKKPIFNIIQFLLLLIFIFLIKNIKAQNSFSPETSIGIKQGFNLSNVKFSTGKAQEWQKGYNGGIVFRHISEPNVGIQIELNYNQKGWNEQIDPLIKYYRKLNYVELPFMIHAEIGKGKTDFLIDIGSFISYLINQKESINTFRLKSTKQYLDAYKQYYGIDGNIDYDFEYGICFGIGIKRKTKVGTFDIECRFNQSLTNIFKKTGNSKYSFSMNQVFNLGLTFMKII